MNYPVVAKKAFKRLRYSAHEVWQNLRELKKNISCLVRNIDDMGTCLSRSRHLVQGLSGLEAGPSGGCERESNASSTKPQDLSHAGPSVWARYAPGGEL
jgi:hypothetical protein